MAIKQIAKNSFDVFWRGVVATGAYKVFKPWYGGLGTILMFHRVRPFSEISLIDAKKTWEVTPEFLESVIHFFQKNNYDILSLDQMVERLASDRQDRRFVCFTFDDGYRDAFTQVYPIFRKNRLPFCLYIATSFPDKNAMLSEDILQTLVTKIPFLEFDSPAGHFSAQMETLSEKNKTYISLTDLVASLSKADAEVLLQGLGRRYQVNIQDIRESQTINWDHLKELASDPLVTLGAHTVNHPPLSSLARAQALWEMSESKRLLETKLGISVSHLAYPYGHPASTGPREFTLSQQAGFTTAVTTNPGNLFRMHGATLHSLCRHNVDGRELNIKAVEKTVCGYHQARANFVPYLKKRVLASN